MVSANGSVALVVRRAGAVAVTSSGILERPADQAGLVGRPADWLQPDRPPATFRPGPADASPAPFERGEGGPTSLPVVIKLAVAGTRPVDVLVAWREAERALAATPTEGPEWSARAATVAERRAAYHLLFEKCRGPREARDPRLIVDLRLLGGRW